MSFKARTACARLCDCAAEARIGIPVREYRNNNRERFRCGSVHKQPHPAKPASGPVSAKDGSYPRVIFLPAGPDRNSRNTLFSTSVWLISQFLKTGAEAFARWAVVLRVATRVSSSPSLTNSTTERESSAAPPSAVRRSGAGGGSPSRRSPALSAPTRWP